ncbi:MAG: T9SS type A sorting domain-containing protein [Candidatus Coatesbacteria bacterium]|nr:MAG: T9SS type A sorting domain-containing protein [Candidatus Coatesbacteria bacterium]
MVKYVKWDGDSWVNCIVDVNAWSSLISQPDIALNSDGDPNITYNFKYDNDDACLKYAAWASSSNNTDSNVGVKYETSGFNRLYNTPNPVNGSVTFNFTLPETTEVDLSIYDLSGRKVTTVADEVKEAGDHAVVFDGYLTPGVYIYKLATPESNAVKKMVVIE